MHWLALLVAAPVLLQGEVKPYVNGAVGMTLEFPAAWQIKAVKDDAAIEIPLNAGMQAKLKILAVAFSSEPDIWQISQKHVNEQMKREVERRIVGTQVSVHVIEDIHIPSFDSANMIHQELATICREGHYTDGLTEARSVMLADLVDKIQAAEINSLARPAMTSTSPSAAAEDQSTVLTSCGT